MAKRTSFILELKTYRDYGLIGRKEDVKTCVCCQGYDGKIYDSNNTPHQHVMCRCELIPLVKGWKPTGKWDNENKQRISYKTYKEWLEEQDLY